MRLRAEGNLQAAHDLERKLAEVTNKLTFFDGKTEVYGANDMVRGGQKISAIKFSTESVYSKGNVELDKIGWTFKCGPRGFTVKAYAHVVDISSEWNIVKFAGMQFSISPSAGWGVKAEAALNVGKIGSASLGAGYGPTASIEVRWRPTDEY